MPGQRYGQWGGQGSVLKGLIVLRIIINHQRSKYNYF